MSTSREKFEKWWRANKAAVLVAAHPEQIARTAWCAALETQEPAPPLTDEQIDQIWFDVFKRDVPGVALATEARQIARRRQFARALLSAFPAGASR